MCGCLCELFLLELYVIIDLSVWSFSINNFFDLWKNCLSLLFIITIYKQKCFTCRRWISIFACSTDKQPAKYITHNKRTHWLLSWPVVYTKTKTKLNWTSQIRFGKEPLESRAQEEPHCIRTHRRHMNKTHCFNAHMLMKTYWPDFFLFLFCWSFFLSLTSLLYYTIHFISLIPCEFLNAQTHSALRTHLSILSKRKKEPHAEIGSVCQTHFDSVETRRKIICCVIVWSNVYVLSHSISPNTHNCSVYGQRKYARHTKIQHRTS